MGRLIDAIAAFWNTLIQPDRERKGQKFEELLVDNIFIKEYYDLLHLTQDGLTNHFRYVKNSEYPDFKFQDKITGKKFWVEAKYRIVWFGEFPDQYLYFTTESKLERYKKVDEQLPVFVAIGTGNKAHDPNQIYLIPVRYIKMADKIYKKFLLPFEIDNTYKDLEKTPEELALPSKALWERIKRKNSIN